MTNSYQILLGWGLVASVAVATLVGLPMMAGASTAIKDQARWEARADNLATVGAEFHSTSNLAKTLAGQHLDTRITNPFMLDSRITADIPQNSSTLIARAKFTERETNCLAEAVYYESRSESLSGQKAVAEVVLNRVGHKAFPSTVCGVVYQGAERTTGCQFSFTCDGSNAILPRGKHWVEAQDVAKHMMMRASSPMTNRATHYHTTAVSPKWAPTLRKLRKYDTHVFYRFMPRKQMLRAMSVAP